MRARRTEGVAEGEGGEVMEGEGRDEEDDDVTLTLTWMMTCHSM